MPKNLLKIFLSGVSSEFGEFRDAVENEIEMKDCFAENQPGFPPDYTTVEQMLRRKLRDSDAVVYIVGFRFGAERNDRPPDKPRRSYTQMEYDIAREMQKPVYIFISKNASVRQPPKPDEQPEDAEAAELQIAHRNAVTGTNHLYYYFENLAELRKLVAEIQLVAGADFRADISRIVKYAPAELIGREVEFKLLSDAWLKVRRAELPRPNVITFVALGGEGKTSLVTKWVADLAYMGWAGCDLVFAWSFYSQGTREQLAASSDLFLKEALVFFGDEQMANSAASGFDKGRRLARLVGERRGLLILDGLEPVQYGPTSPTPGELKDQGIAALLKGLATSNHGLCVITTRYSVPDLKAFWQTTAPEEKLARLSRAAGVHLLKTLGVNGSERRKIPRHDDDPNSEKVNEFEKLVEDVKGHALTLTLLGGFLKRAFHGDIRQRDRVKFEKADAKMDGGHAFRTMAAYEKWLLRDEGDEGKREVAVLRLMGLFDRPADADCLAALRSETIVGLTEPLAGLADDDWEFCLSGLEGAKLLTVNRDVTGTLVSLDAHPHLREYFAKQLREQLSVPWRTAHRLLYEHLCKIAPKCTMFDKQDEMWASLNVPKRDTPTLEDLQPLYQAIVHGCQAGLYSEVIERIYARRILRVPEYYTITKLGAFGSELGALACFFEIPWVRASQDLPTMQQAWLLGQVAYCLRASGRLTEAITPQRASLEIRIEDGNWIGAARTAHMLSELRVALGDLSGAIEDAKQSLTYADRSGNWSERCNGLTTLADAMYQMGRRREAEEHFREAEKLLANQKKKQQELSGLSSFQYCELLINTSERNAWQAMQVIGDAGQNLDEIQTCRVVFERTSRNQRGFINLRTYDLLDKGLDHLMLGRAALCAAILQGKAGSSLLFTNDQTRSKSPECVQSADLSLKTASLELDAAVDGLRRAGDTTRLPLSLLTRAWLRGLTSAPAGPDSAKTDLDEAWEIAERGPMPLFLADIHLHRARLFGGKNHAGEKYPWQSPQHDLAEARRLIFKHGYLRRKEELEDAEAALKNWSQA